MNRYLYENNYIKIRIKLIRKGGFSEKIWKIICAAVNNQYTIIQR